jgi:N-acetylmuramic acid 6-phosphate etherase
MEDLDCDAFLKTADKFKLGGLETEKPHPLTVNLSRDAQTNLAEGIESLKEVDRLALQQMFSHLPTIADMGRDVYATWAAGRTVYLCGCGATGRLSISLEVFCRSGMISEQYRESVIGFMAGGDTALTKTIEKFEDFPEFGERQLLELGFTDGDLLISTTEGGETPFVIGATEAAARISTRHPWFLFCNPEEQLRAQVERSKRVLQNPNINSLSLFVGPMALSGSTRMQASTVLMTAVGWSLAYGGDTKEIENSFNRLATAWNQLDLETLSLFIQNETDCYRRGEFVIYETETAGVTLLTDTTERSPTFSTPPFENENSPRDLIAWCYLSIPTAETALQAWKQILKRPPRCLDWKDIDQITTQTYMEGFDVGKKCEAKRKTKTNGAIHHRFQVEFQASDIRLHFMGESFQVPTPGLNELERNLILKMILNIHSTLFMGALGRYESNLMTYVRPTNLKLIDRTIRYVEQLMEHRGHQPASYERIARKLFSIKNLVPIDEPIVLRVLESLLSEL